ncbi:MAG TPA: hypothetical protein PLV92_23630, partial [Pirellulaceae bacterium]|nr:hypothetical protein [Pirellulaceae bacterium]
MSKSPRYDDDRRIELWTRQLDGQALNEAEAADLVRALIDDTELRGVLDGDDRIHGLLRASASLVKPKGDSRQSRATPHDDGEQFVAEVLARLDRVLPQEVIPLPPVSVAPVSIASSSFDNASVPPMNGPPADAAGVVP